MTAPLERWYREGRRQWPNVELSADDFARFVDQRVEGTPDAELAADLYLACACAGGEAGAIEAFTALYSPEIERVAARVTAPGVSADDARQILLERLLVGIAGKPPRIASYAARGSLRGWVRVTAVRLLIDIFRSGARVRETTIEQSMLEEIADSSDPEIAYLKKHYREQFGQAFEAAVAALAPRSRNYLRHLFVEKLTVDQLAGLYGVHRSTAARRMAVARDALLDETRRQLVAQLKIEYSELESIMRLISSRIELSVQRIFEPSQRRADETG